MVSGGSRAAGPCVPPQRAGGAAVGVAQAGGARAFRRGEGDGQSVKVTGLG